MKPNDKYLTLYISLFLLLLIGACTSMPQKKSDKSKHPEEQRVADLGNGFYQNPILGGDYPDPSVLKVGDAWYMTHSSFDYAPGLLIWKSHDLINWEPICNALNTHLGSVFAPDLIEHNTKYYIYFPVLGINPATRKRGFSNWVVIADNPEGPWGEPINLNIGNIDPGHVVDDKGNRYLHLSDGHIVPISEDGTTVTAAKTKVYDGWEYPKDWVVEGFCLESPKLLKRHGYYYLTSAEGGTAGPATSHMVVSARSKTPFGPWEHSPYNPIIRTYYSSETWFSKGHGTVFEGPEDKWYCMFHGYEKGFYTLGRQTLMEPIVWTDDNWFKLADNSITDEPLPAPKGKALNHGGQLSDDFEDDNLSLMWRFYGEYDTTRFYFTNGDLHLKGRGNSPSNSAPLMVIPTNKSYEVEVELEFTGNAVGGLILFYSPDAYSALGLSNKGLARYKFNNPAPWRNMNLGSKAFLKLRNNEHQITYFYSSDGKAWENYPSGAEVSGFHHNTFGKFLSLRVGLFATGNGELIFKSFKYKGLD